VSGHVRALRPQPGEGRGEKRRGARAHETFTGKEPSRCGPPEFGANRRQAERCYATMVGRERGSDENLSSVGVDSATV
jgi:hypothetical protein